MCGDSLHSHFEVFLHNFLNNIDIISVIQGSVVTLFRLGEKLADVTCTIYSGFCSSKVIKNQLTFE